MAKTSAELEREFIDQAAGQTGRSVTDWLAMIGSSGISGHNDLLTWLKKGHGLNHMQAQFLAGMHENNGRPVYQDESQLLNSHFERSGNMKPLFEELSAYITGAVPGSQLIVKKTYLSFAAVREFAAMNIKPNEIRLGLDLGEQAFTATLLKSKLTGPMPRISHMLIFTDSSQFGKHTQDLVLQSYNRSHKK